MHFHTIRIFTKILLILALFNTTPIFTQELDQNTFTEQILSAYQSENINQLKSLIQNHRLMVKPFIDDQLEQSIKAEFQNNKALANQKLKLSKRVAEIFAEIHDEKSLAIAVDYVSIWTKDQKGKKLHADSLYILGTKLRGKKDTRDQALGYYEEALKIYNQISDLRGKGSTLGGIGVVYWYLGDAEKTLSHFQEGLEFRQQVNDLQLIGNAYNDIGSVYLQFFKDDEKAIMSLLESEKIREAIGEEKKLARTFGVIAHTYWNLGQYDFALEYYQKAIDLNQKLGNEKQIARNLHNTGILLKNMGNYPLSLDKLEQALTIREKLGNQKDIATTLNQIGIVYKRLGEFEPALKYYQKTLALMEEAKDEKGIGRALVNIGVIFGRLGRTEQAVVQFQKALEIFQRIEEFDGILETLSNLGISYLDMRNYTQSEQTHKEALQMSRDLGDKIVEVNNLIGLGNVQNFMGKLDTAQANYQQGIDLARQLNNTALEWPALLGLGDNYERRRDYENAIKYYDLALNKVEDIHSTLKSTSYKASFLAEQRYIYEAVIHLLGKLYQNDKTKGYENLSLHYAERGKARVFLDLMAEALANVRQGADKELLQKQETLLAEISSIEQTLQQESTSATQDDSTINILKTQAEKLDKDYQKLKKEIREKNPQYSHLQYPDPVTVGEVQSGILDGNSILLEYLLGDSSSSLWAVTMDNIYFYSLPNRNQFQEQLEIIRFVLLNPSNKNFELFANTSYSLYQQLIQPVEHLIKGDKRLLIVPDSELNLLPFEILITDNTDKTFTDLSFLLKQNPISYAQSASVLKNIKTATKKTKKSHSKELFAIGDPDFGVSEQSTLHKYFSVRKTSQDSVRGGMVRLPYSGQEIQNIANIFDDQKVDYYLRDEATEEQIKDNPNLDQYRFLHFATHGIINEKKPDFSGLVLAQDENPKEDGYLHTAEIFNLNLNADLVILSACKTGLGKMIRGEGIEGLSRAFMYAGTPSVLVSLWSVSDKSTSVLMEEFYINLIKSDQNKTESLRKAKLSLIKNEKFAHPFYWAPFILIGDWQ